MAVFTLMNSEPIGQILTAEEYDALPESRRRELVDGVIRMMASPTGRHQHVARMLCNLLEQSGRPEHRAIENIEIRLADDLRRVPDVLVVPASAYDGDRCRYLPHEVVLAVEVVSRGSEHADRTEKPAEYAEAGIPLFWRIEPAPVLAVYTYRLEAGRYLPTGQFRGGQLIRVEGLDWLAVPVSDLID